LILGSLKVQVNTHDKLTQNLLQTIDVDVGFNTTTWRFRSVTGDWNGRAFRAVCRERIYI